LTYVIEVKEPGKQLLLVNSYLGSLLQSWFRCKMKKCSTA